MNHEEICPSVKEFISNIVSSVNKEYFEKELAKEQGYYWEIVITQKNPLFSFTNVIMAKNKELLKKALKSIKYDSAIEIHIKRKPVK